MCALLRYSAGGLAALLTTAYVAVSAESGTGAFRPSVVEPSAVGQTLVNRTTKGDREANLRDARNPSAQRLPATSLEKKKLPTPPKERKILEGCDPAFSPLTASAKNNFASRCVV